MEKIAFIRLLWGNILKEYLHVKRFLRLSGHLRGDFTVFLSKLLKIFTKNLLY